MSMMLGQNCCSQVWRGRRWMFLFKRVCGERGIQDKIHREAQSAEKRVIKSEKYSHGEQERFSIVIIAWNDVERGATYRVVQVPVLYLHPPFENQNHLALVKHINIVKQLDSIEDLLECFFFDGALEMTLIILDRM